MNNIDLIAFAKTWMSLNPSAQAMIEDIVCANDLSPTLLKRMHADALEYALDELRCCNVPGLVRTIDEALEEKRCHQHEKSENEA